MVRMLDIYHSVIDTLKKYKNEFPLALGCLTLFKDINFLKKFMVFVDILAIFNGMSTTFQKRQLFITEIESEIKNAINGTNCLFLIKNYFQGYWYSSLIEEYSNNKTFNNVKLTGEEESDNFNLFLNQIHECCIKCIESRFIDNSIINNFEAFNIDRIKTLSINDLTSYGIESL
jgi:hypothetical protein